ncbi:MAG: hypothetical protein IPH78_01490 [Bacteroidetes bacterium]|nr:hypothetical protein [Bacteroidota bacterium]
MILAIAILLTTAVAYTQTPTWANQISCVLYSHCTSCHNPNGLAPFSLLSYTDAYNKRIAIVNSVSSGKMPPYLPDLSYSRFAHERVLSSEEITLISAWVSGGAPSGDTTQAPATPVYSTTEEITSPDLVGRMPTFTVPNTGGDLYQAFIVTNPSPTVQYITEMEVVPGNRNIVHHVLVFQDTTNVPVANDSAYAGPGYVSFGGIGSNKAQLISAWVPGSGVYSLPSGMGIRLAAGARIVIQVHYPLGSGGQVDSTKLNIKFSPTTLRNVSIAPILNSGNITNGPFAIPANSVKTFYSQYTVPANVTVVSVAPHAHLINTKFEVFGVTPANDTLRFIRINDWDFHWQGAQNFQKPIKVPTGTVLHGIAVYDNTPNNPHHPNPSNPQLVTQGEATSDEMMLIYFGYLLYQNGDENIIVDTSSHLAHYLDCEPEALVSGVNDAVTDLPRLTVAPNPF